MQNWNIEKGNWKLEIVNLFGIIYENICGIENLRGEKIQSTSFILNVVSMKHSFNFYTSYLCTHSVEAENATSAGRATARRGFC